MIRITRTQTPPARLISHGPYAALLHSAVIGTGTPLTFDKGIYGAVLTFSKPLVDGLRPCIIGRYCWNFMAIIII